ncbi:MAG TPA: 8-amino-7-oxononanoate synthase family protein [Polyangia bacterium]
MQTATAELPHFTTEVEIERYTSIAQVPLAIWERFASRAAVGLEAAHLRALEASRINDLRPYYLIGFAAGEPVGIAYCFAMDMDLTKLVTEDPPEVIAAVKTWKPGFMDLRLIEVGHLASLGTTIAAAPAAQDAFLRALAAEVEVIARLEDADLGVIRDVAAARYDDFRVLEEDGYRPAPGFAIARLQLGWPSFDGYLAALKSKTRANVRRKQAALQAPGIAVEVIEDYAPYAQRLAELWGQVARRHGEYEHERLTPAWFEAMARHLAGRSHVLAIKRHGTIVAFGLALIGDEDYFGAAEGLDDAVRDSYELYANLFFETIRVACALGKKTLNLGITTYDFKASLGAELEPCVYFVKAFKQPEYSAAYADLFRKGIKPPANHHRAFGARDVSRRVQPRDVEALFRAHDDPRDPFVKQVQYVRADAARAAGLYAFCPVFESAQEPVVQHGGREVIMLGTNSYLGLATHPRVKAAAIAAVDEYGSGCSGSPMLNGTLDLHQRLIRQLARFMHKPDALVCSTGYQTNVGVVSTLVGPGDVVLMDERNHASLIDGARLARATLVRYRHADPAALEAELQRHAPAATLVVTDSLFSMEGTVIDLPAVVRLVKKHHARLMLDESHAIGVMGPTGRGVAEHYGLLAEVDLVMGTLSKSLASIGGFVAGERKIIDTLKHTARAHLFSASLPPAAVAAALEALTLIDEEPARRARLLANARFLAQGLRRLGYQASYHGNGIVPVFCGNELLALAAFHRLLEEGVFVNPVTYPAVPRHQEMLRLSLMATHDEAMLRRALDVFARARTATWPAATPAGGRDADR